MRTIEESVVTAMDGSVKELFPYLPYILQDYWEIGADPDVIIKLIGKHFTNCADLKVLDLGCGKGAVSVKIAKKLGYECYGIDAIPAFIDFAIEKAKEYNVRELCKYEVGDIREKVKNLTHFDIIILGSIGQIFGNYYETLKTLSSCLKHDGLIVIDDGYIEDKSDFSHPQILKKQELLDQLNSAKMQLIDEVRVNEFETAFDNYDTEYAYVEKRCLELIGQYPEKSYLFENYMKQQKGEYDTLKSKVVCSTMIIQRKTN